MKESIRNNKKKKEPWIKKGEIGSTLFRSCIGVIFIMSALIIGALVNYEDVHRYYQKYCTKTEKVEYLVVKCAEKEQGKYYLCLRNLKTGRKIMKECDFNDYILYEPGNKITFNLTKAQLAEQGEYKIDDKDSKDYLIIRLTFCLSIVCLGPLLVLVFVRNEKTSKYKRSLVNITIVYDILALVIVVFEYIAL